MKPITLITGNKHKLAEYKRLLPVDFAYTSQSIDLQEIQSMDLVEIISDKAQHAYAIVGSPLIVEDVSAGLDDLNGLPGPFIKYFEENMGQDALYQLAKGRSNNTTVQCLAAYYDGATLLVGRGTVCGTVVETRADTGFGFDNVFVPNGQKLTYAEMGTEIKDNIGHRALAIRDLLHQLTDVTK